jgi:transposase
MSNVPVYVGIDYAQDFVQACVLDEAGAVKMNKRVANDWQAIVQAVQAHGQVKRVAIEACTGSADLGEELVDKAGWQVDLAHPAYVAKLRGSPDKTDFSDSQLLGDLTRVGYLPRVWLAPAAVRQLRQLVNFRQQLVDQRRACKLRVGAVLREHRLKLPPKLSRWSKGWIAFVSHASDLPEDMRWIVQQTLQQIDDLSGRIAQVEERLRQATNSDAVVRKLMQQEGIGEVTAWTLRAFVGRFDRFGSGKQLSRYCGLSPRNVSSGGREADGGLIKMSNKILRAILIQASHRLIRTSGRWGRLAESMRSRGKPACVIVAAVANRWMRKLYHEMKDTAEKPTMN